MPAEQSTPPAAVVAAEAPARVRPSNYPEPFASRMAGRVKRPLGADGKWRFARKDGTPY